MFSGQTTMSMRRGWGEGELKKYFFLIEAKSLRKKWVGGVSGPFIFEGIIVEFAISISELSVLTNIQYRINLLRAIYNILLIKFYVGGEEIIVQANMFLFF